MKIVSFNVNSVRLRLHQLAAHVAAHDPDVIGLQETKVVDEDFPVDAIAELGYRAVFAGQKTHYGVAILAKTEPRNVRVGFDTDGPDAQTRLIRADVTAPDGTVVHVVNGYFPQGEKRSHPVKFPAKERFYADLARLLETERSADAPLALVGDFNVAPSDADIGIGPENAKRWLRTGSTSFLPEEREWFARLTDWGLADTFRTLHPKVDDLHSWFDYRSRGFERTPKRGLKIDHVLATRPLIERLTGAGIDQDVRGMNKPSDHCPVWASFDLGSPGA